MNPSERGSAPTNPQTKDSEEKPQEGDYRDVEKTANNPSSFDDDYEVAQENEISREEAGTENDYDEPGKRSADQA